LAVKLKIRITDQHWRSITHPSLGHSMHARSTASNAEDRDAGNASQGGEY
jgi:hypothetical protein